ncbi:hypothetical protein L1887_46088 [Cichorium endivia]|nr:hypothetical protein L1887_46088 [Cichorium endivia]
MGIVLHGGPPRLIRRTGLANGHVPLGAEGPYCWSKGSLGHAFTVRIRTGNQNQTSFYPSVPHEISVLVELILGHLRYLLTDVPPPAKLPLLTMSSARIGLPRQALGSKKRGIAPLPIHGISKITLKVVVFHFRPRAPTYTTPLKSFHKVGLESSSTGRIPLVRTSSELAVRRPGKAPEGAVPSCSPWRPDAVMSTSRAVGGTRSSGFSRAAGGRTGHRATCGALPAAGPYLRLSLPFTWNLSPLRPSKFSFEYLLLPPRSAPTAASAQAHAQGFAATAAPSYSSGPGHLPRRPGVGRALKRHPFSGLVDSAVSLRASTRVSSGFAPLRHSSPSFGVPDRQCSPLEPFSEDQGRSAVHPARGIPPISFLAPCGVYSPVDSHTCQTPWSVFQDGPNGVPTGRCRGARRYIAETARAANHDRRDGISTSLSTARALAAAPIRTGPRPESIGGPAIAVPHPTGTHRRPPFASLPTISRHSLTLFSKSFSSFPRGYLFAIGLTPVFSLGRNLPPYWGLRFPNNPTRRQRLVGATGSGHDGALTLSWAPPSRGLGARSRR